MMTSDEAYSTVTHTLHNVLEIGRSFTEDTTIDSLGLDSLQLIQLFSHLEDSFDIDFTSNVTLDAVRSLTLKGFADLLRTSNRNT